MSLAEVQAILRYSPWWKTEKIGILVPSAKACSNNHLQNKLPDTTKYALQQYSLPHFFVLNDSGGTQLYGTSDHLSAF